MIYIITSGEYDYYRIEAAVQHETEQDLDGLWEQFRAQTNMHTDNPHEVFADWLVREHGFIKHNWTDFNTD